MSTELQKVNMSETEIQEAGLTVNELVEANDELQRKVEETKIVASKDFRNYIITSFVASAIVSFSIWLLVALGWI
ncbi:hypothetical protein KJ885_05400 [Patescibacteria group bacterium]|nr:hypothetical protein [Patescibacteria group bacterium]